MFTVDSEFEIGNKRIPSEEVADADRYLGHRTDLELSFKSRGTR
jgi:hypothetical protein